MPTYPYACTECGHQFETRQSFSDDPLTECPECNGRLKKVWGSVGVVFKGSGFYRTDSRGSGSSSSSGDTSSSKGDSSGSSGSSEKKTSEKKSGDSSSSSSSSGSSSSSSTGSSAKAAS